MQERPIYIRQPALRAYVYLILEDGFFLTVLFVHVKISAAAQMREHFVPINHFSHAFAVSTKLKMKSAFHWFVRKRCVFVYVHV